MQHSYCYIYFFETASKAPYFDKIKKELEKLKLYTLTNEEFLKTNFYDSNPVIKQINYKVVVTLKLVFSNIKVFESDDP